MAKVRDYGKLAADIKDLIGESNILGATHCATRLRLILKEEPSDEITKKIEQKPGVIQVVKAGGQYQIVIGMHAKDVYEELSKIMTFAEDAPQAKVGLLDRLIAIMSGSITPFVYVLAGAGLLQGTLIILRLIIGEDVINPSGIGQIYDMISWTPFTFLPVFIAVSASRHFKCNTYIALWCCLALANPTWGTIAQGIAEGNGLKFGIIPLTSVTYTATVIPPIIMTFQKPTLIQLLFMFLTGCAALCGQMNITKAYAYAPAKEISVYDYSGVIFAAILGMIFLGEKPDLYSIIGYMVIIGASVLAFMYNNGYLTKTKGES